MRAAATAADQKAGSAFFTACSGSGLAGMAVEVQKSSMVLRTNCSQSASAETLLP
jgi:hypothetical protein